MTDQPDTLAVTGPNFAQTKAGNLLVTPVGGVQTTLANALTAPVSQGSLLAGQVAANTSATASLAQQSLLLSQQAAALQASTTLLLASVATLQDGQTSNSNRLTVLETATPPPAVPNAPTGLHSTAITTTTIAMALTAPASGVAPDTYQWAYALPQASGVWTNGPSTVGTTTTLTGLTPSTAYDVRATSVSTAAGPGGVSATYPVSTGVAPPVVTAPQAPTGLSAAATTNTLTVTAAPPAQGSPPTSYHWEYRTPAGSGAYTSGPTGPTVPAVISGLTPATAYGVRVTGINSAGTGTPSAEFVTATATGASVSPDGTLMPPAASIIMADTTVVTLVGGQLLFGGVVEPGTANVILAFPYNNGVIYQENNAGNWWYLDRTQGWPWVATTDPRVVVTPPPPVNNPNVTVNLGALTGKTVSRFMFGFSTGALADNGFAWLANATARASVAKLKPTCIRINANGDFIRRYALGQTTILDNLINNLSVFDPGLRLNFGFGPNTASDTGTSAATWASYCTTFANHMHAIGHDVLYYECSNETAGIDFNYYCDVFNQCANAFHAVNPAIKIGGTCADWWGNQPSDVWVAQCGPRIGFGSYHGYIVPASDSRATYIGKALSNNDANAFRSSLVGLSNIEMGMTEWNMGDLNARPEQAQIDGAIFGALLLIRQFHADSNFTMGNLWDIISDSNYGVIANVLLNSDPAQIDQQGWFLGISGQVMGGAEVSATTTLPNVQCLAVNTPAGSRTMIVNYGLVAQSATIGISNGTVGNVSMKQLTSSTSTINGPTSVPLSSLTGINLPAQSITWVLG